MVIGSARLLLLQEHRFTMQLAKNLGCEWARYAHACKSGRHHRSSLSALRTAIRQVSRSVDSDASAPLSASKVVVQACFFRRSDQGLRAGHARLE
jgi:hypothetical protein